METNSPKVVFFTCAGVVLCEQVVVETNSPKVVFFTCAGVVLCEQVVVETNSPKVVFLHVLELSCVNRSWWKRIPQK